MSEWLNLVCEKCGAKGRYPRFLDKNIPAWVETLSHSHCDLPDCDTFDRHIETWLDGNGVARDPAEPPQ